MKGSASAAAQLDAEDPLGSKRKDFHIPTYSPTENHATPPSDDAPSSEAKRPRLAVDAAPRDVAYLCGNSLGLQPKSTAEAVTRELKKWASLGVEGHFTEPLPWVSIEDSCVDSMARLVGSGPGAREVVVMNSLTVNLHLMLGTFYRPSGNRRVILMERGAFPSDEYAVTSHVRARGGDPTVDVAYVESVGSSPDGVPRTEEVVETIKRLGDSLCLVLLGGVNYYSGYVFDLERVSREAHRVGALAGFDLAHAVGNVPLRLHDWGCDFAVWCTYKYLNSGPGGIAGAFVHSRHADVEPAFAGWWGHRREERFLMRPEFHASRGADRFQLSNPPVLCVVALRASLDVFDSVELPQLWEKSRRLVEFLLDGLARLDAELPEKLQSLTRKQDDPTTRGCQVSVRILGERPNVKEKSHVLSMKHGVVCDAREPDVLRVAPVPLYNSFADVVRFLEALRDVLSAEGKP